MASLDLVITVLALFLLPVKAWIATRYVLVTVEPNPVESTDTMSIIVGTTGPVSPFSTATINPDSGVTLIDLLISGDNLPVTKPHGPYYDCTLSSGCPNTATSYVYELFYAPITITQPPSCTATQFSYQTSTTVTPPDELLDPINLLSFVSVTGYMTTSIGTDADGRTTASTTYSEVDYYLDGSQVLPTLDPATELLLEQCQDPRGCYLGQGLGCTAAGGAALTESHGPISTSKSTPTKPGSSSASTKTNAAARNTISGGVEGMWVWAVVSVSILLGVGFIL